MASKKGTQQYILLPIRGLRANNRNASDETRNFLLDAFGQFSAGISKKSAVFSEGIALTSAISPQVNIRVLDSIAGDGAKLVEMSDSQVLTLRENQPGLRLVPLVYYYPQNMERRIEGKVATAAAGKLRLRIVSEADGKPVAGARVIAFTDFANRFGADGLTNTQGNVDLSLGGLSARLERIYIYPPKDLWPAVKKSLAVKSGDTMTLVPIDLSFTDALRHFYGNSPDDEGGGVRVAVVDTGVALDHPDLTVMGGENTVLGEEASDFGDNGGHHGSHVAGIISARGIPPTGVRGLAPQAEIFSFRVFGKGEDGASNFAIAKAIDRAIQNNCDLINLSLGGGSSDPAIQAAIEDASAAGSLAIIATGNDSRSPVSFPASFSPPAIAVSAMGRRGTFPENTTASDSVAKPFGDDGDNFIASFSNIGPEVDLTGTGVGIISTVPGGYAAMDGTSMATPAVTGFAAKLLAGKRSILDMSRDQARSDAMTQELVRSAKPLGFGAEFEGNGFPSDRHGQH